MRREHRYAPALALMAPPSWGRHRGDPKFILGEFRSAVADLKKVPTCAAGAHKLGWASSRVQVGCNACWTWAPGRLDIRRETDPEFAAHLDARRQTLGGSVFRRWAAAEGHRPAITEDFVATNGARCPDDHPFWTLLAEIRPEFDALTGINSQCAVGTHKRVEVVHEEGRDTWDIRCMNCHWVLLSLSQDEWARFCPPEERLETRIGQLLHIVAMCVVQVRRWGGTLSPPMLAQFQEFAEAQTPPDRHAIFARMAAECQRNMAHAGDIPPGDQGGIPAEITNLGDLCPGRPASEWAAPLGEIMQDLQTSGRRVARSDLVNTAISIASTISGQEGGERARLDRAWQAARRVIDAQNTQSLLRREKLERDWIRPAPGR